MGDVEAPSTGVAPPTKAKDVKPKELQVRLGFLPALCPGTRKWLYLWYPGPTVCAHTMHWTEYVFVSFTLCGVVFFIVGTSVVPAVIMGLLMTLVSALAFIGTWGYAKYKSLAELAERLEVIAAANHNEVKALTDINDEWAKNMKENEKNVDQFAKQMGFVGEDAKNLDKVKDVLKGLVETKKNLQREERRCFETTVKAKDVTAAEVREKEIDLLKRRAANQFSRLDRRPRKGSKGKGDGELSGEEVEKFKQWAMQEEFLNKFEWLPLLEEFMADGALKQYECMHMLEKATGSYFIEMKNAFVREAELKKKLQDLRSMG